MNYVQYTVTIEAGEEGGPAVLAIVDVTDGRPVIAEVHYRRGAGQETSALAAWDGLDLDAIAWLLPAAGAAPHEENEPVEPVKPSFVRAVKQKTKASNGKPTGSALQVLRQAILGGAYPTGKPLPPRAELVAAIPGATHYQIKMAVKALQAEGLLAPGQRRDGIMVLDGRTPARKATGAKKSLNPRENQAPPDDELLAAYQKHGGYGLLARALGVSYATARNWVTLAKRRQEMSGRPIVRDAVSASA